MLTQTTVTGLTATLSAIRDALTQTQITNFTYNGVGTGSLSGLITDAGAVPETVTVLFTTSTSFTVDGSESGNLGGGTVGSFFACSACTFLAVAGGTAFAAGDQFVFNIVNGWTVNRDAGGELILSNVGNSGQQSVCVGFKIVGESLQLMSALAYTNVAFGTQPGAQTGQFINLWSGSIPLWIVSDADSVTVVAKVSTVFQAGFVGFLSTLVSPLSYAAPLYVGGTSSSAISYTVANETHSVFALQMSDSSVKTYKYRDGAGVWKTATKTEPDLTNLGFYGSLSVLVDGSAVVLPIAYDSVCQLPTCYKFVATGASAESIIVVGGNRYLVVQDVFRAGALFAVKTL